MESLNSHREGSPHDLNAHDSGCISKIDGFGNVHRRAVNEEASENLAESKTADYVHEPSPSSIRQGLTANDVSTINTARARLLHIVVNHFMAQHVVEVMDCEAEQLFGDELPKRKSAVVRYEGDPQYALLLMYVINIYETFVKEVDARLASLDGFQGKTIGLDFGAMEGLFRKLAKKFPEKGPITFKRRELAAPAETRTRFPELVVEEEKGLRLVVVNGLEIVEKPGTLSVADAEWFKRVTGRSEVFISARDYKFYSPRHIYQDVESNFLPGFTNLHNEAEVCFNINENDLGDLTILPEFITQANEYCYFERHRKATKTGAVTDLVFSNPGSLDLLRAFPDVLIIDAIYKKNRYNIPFCELLGFTSTGKEFNLACAFISAEREDNYIWLLKQISDLCLFAMVIPNTIVTLTDPDQALFNAVKRAFPCSKHLLGWNHIYKNIEDRCLKDTCFNSIATAFEFVNACKTLFESKTENVYEERLALLENDWKSKKGLVVYLKQTWLMPYKDKIVSVWADKVLHFGTNTMTRVESSGLDRSVKQLLSSSDSSYSNFELLWCELNAAIRGQGLSVLRSFDQLGKNVPCECKRIDELMKYEVSYKAYEIMAQEYKCVKGGDKYPSTCVCQLRVSHGLPCAHEMEKYVANRTEIPPEAIHRFWWQLNLNVDEPEDPFSGARDFVVDLFIMFREMSMDEKMRCTYAVKKILELCMEEPPTSMANDRSGDFFRKFFTCEWYSEPGLFSSEDDTPPMTPHSQPPFGISSSETFGPARGSIASKPNAEPVYIYESQKHIPSQLKAKSIHNDRDKIKEGDLGDLAILRQFLKEATKHYYFNRHRKAPGTNVLTDLVFAYPDSLAVLRVHPYVLIINATCRENRYKIPFFEVVGITSRVKRFTVACAFICAEREDNYVWVLNQINELCCFVREAPKTIVTMTGPDQALFNAVEQAFPHTKHLLGWDNIYKHIEDRCLKDMCSNIIASRFVKACKKLFDSETGKVYEKRLASMENKWKNKQGLIGYLKQMWLMPYKDKIVSAWADKVLHFGVHLIDRVESTLKKCLCTPDCSFDDLWWDLRMEIVSQTNKTRLRAPYRVEKMGIFEDLQYSVSDKAFEILAEEYESATSGDNPSKCVCHLRESYGLPCAHEMAKYVADQTPIPLKAIHEFWGTHDDLWFFPDNPSDRARAFVLDLFIRFRGMRPSAQIRCEHAVNVIMQAVEEPQPTSLTKEDQYDKFIRNWFSEGRFPHLECSSSDGNTSPQPHGKSMSISPCSSNSNSYSDVKGPSSEDNTSAQTSSNNSSSSNSYSAYLPEKPLNVPYVNPAYIPEQPHDKLCVEDMEPYISEIPNFMVPYVTDYYEDDACGHSGFQAIAGGVEYGENGWHRVRGDLFKELASHSDVYAPVFASDTVEKVLKALAVWNTSALLPEQQFSLPDMGHLVATHYQLVFVVLGQLQSVTFLPLYVDDQAKLSDMKELCLVHMHHGNKFILVTMDEGFPLPSVHPLWACHHQRSVDGLDGRYGDRFQKYKWFQSFMDQGT